VLIVTVRAYDVTVGACDDTVRAYGVTQGACGDILDA
jgi:hypothetical protein